MLKGIIAISGKPGLYKLLSHGKNSLIVENISTGKRMPAYTYEKVISLADIYSDNGDVPLGDVLTSLYTVAEGKPVDVKALGGDAEIREYFAKVLPDFDRDRVYTTDIRKLFAWYNTLIAAGITEFKDGEIAEDKAAEAAEAADAEQVK